MDDPLVMRGFKCRGDLAGDGQGLVEGDGALRDSVGQGLPVNQFKDQRGVPPSPFSKP